MLQLHDAAKVGSRVPKPPLLIDRQMPRWKRPPASALPLLFLPLNPRLPPPPPHPLICLPHFVRIRPALLIGFVRRGRFPTLNTRKYLPRYHAYVWFVTCAVVALQIGSGGYGGIVYEGYTFCGLVPYNLKNPFVVMEFVLSTLQARDQPPAFGLIAPRVPRVSTSRRHPPLPPSLPRTRAELHTVTHTHHQASSFHCTLTDPNHVATVMCRVRITCIRTAAPSRRRASPWQQDVAEHAPCLRAGVPHPLVCSRKQTPLDAVLHGDRCCAQLTTLLSRFLPRALAPEAYCYRGPR